MSVFTYEIAPPGITDSNDDNIDVWISYNGKSYFATFFTLKSLHSLFHKNARTGECADGTYLWAADMIIVSELTDERIRNTIESLIINSELESACSEIAIDTPE